MTTEFNLADAIACGEVSGPRRFEGLKNTQELQDKVSKMFYGAIIYITNVQGIMNEFKCTMTSKARSVKEIKELVSIFERNTCLTTKISKYK